MQITIGEITVAMALRNKVNIMDLIQDSTDTTGFGAIASLLTRGGATKYLMGEEKDSLNQEIRNQSECLWIILTPLWIHFDRKLPMVTKKSIDNVLDLGTRGHWQEASLYSSISEMSSAWGELVDDFREHLQDSVSDTFVAIIAQAYLNELNEHEVSDGPQDESKGGKGDSFRNRLRDAIDRQFPY